MADERREPGQTVDLTPGAWQKNYIGQVLAAIVLAIVFGLFNTWSESKANSKDIQRIEPVVVKNTDRIVNLEQTMGTVATDVKWLRKYFETEHAK